MATGAGLSKSRNTGPTVNTNNSGDAEAPYEHQEYPKMLFGTGGRTKVVNDPEEHADALEDDWVEHPDEVEETDKDAEIAALKRKIAALESGEGEAVAAAPAAKSAKAKAKGKK